jgi:hypothetical protein
MLAIAPLRFLYADKRFGCLTESYVGIRRDIENLSTLLLTPRKDGINQVPEHVTIPGGQFPRLTK